MIVDFAKCHTFYADDFLSFLFAKNKDGFVKAKLKIYDGLD